MVPPFGKRGAMADRGSDKRRFPRATEHMSVRLFMADDTREFEATVYTADISLTGAFFITEFFLKPGTVLDLEFHMPTDDRVVHTRGVIVREVHVQDGGKGVVSGFAMRFTEYFADAKTVLATAFLAADMDDFIDDYLRRRTAKPKGEHDLIREAIVTWEVGKMELKEGELDLMRDSIRVDGQGRLRRR
jgi:hypothetical protein